MRTEKILKLAKGYRGRSKNCRRLAANRVYKGLEHAFRHRKEKKREFRTLWIQGISGGLSEYDYQYSRFIHHLKKADIQLNRNVLSDMAQTEPFSFKAIVDVVRHIEENNLGKDVRKVKNEADKTAK